MTILQSMILGLIQGIAEFLPISSSGHLAVAQNLFGLSEIPMLYDVLLHVATLEAVLIYFRKKIGKLFCVLGRWITRRPAPDTIDEEDFLCGTEERGRKTIIAVIISTIITGIIGIVTSKLIPDLSIKVTCAGFIVTACLLFFSSIMEKREKRIAEKTTVSDSENTVSQEKEKPKSDGISWIQAIVIGIMQGIGTLPGISRSGSTIAGGQLSKLNRTAAGEYSFIISIPAILGAFILSLKDYVEIMTEGTTEAIQAASISAGALIAGWLVAFISGYFALAFLMKLIKKGKLEWFACYLIPVGILGMIFLK